MLHVESQAEMMQWSLKKKKNCSLLSHQLTATLFCSHLQAGAGWPGVSAVSNGGVVEPAQGVNGTVLANQSSMGTAGYHTH